MKTRDEEENSQRQRYEDLSFVLVFDKFYLIFLFLSSIFYSTEGVI